MSFKHHICPYLSIEKNQQCFSVILQTQVSAEILLVAAMVNVTKMTITTTANVTLDLQARTVLKVSTQLILSHKLSDDFLRGTQLIQFAPLFFQG